jgi:hypothetical protein
MFTQPLLHSIFKMKCLLCSNDLPSIGMDPVTAFNCSLERNETAQPADLVLDCHDSLLLRFCRTLKKPIR